MNGLVESTNAQEDSDDSSNGGNPENAMCQRTLEEELESETELFYSHLTIDDEVNNDRNNVQLVFL